MTIRFDVTNYIGKQQQFEIFGGIRIELTFSSIFIIFAL